MKIISKNFQQIEVLFSLDTTVYLNATQIAKKFKTPKGNSKDINEWLKSKPTTEYLIALKNTVPENFGNDLIIVKQGGKANEQGTWIHKSLIILFARWLSPEFAVWCDLQIEEILKSGTISAQSLTVKDQIFGLESAIKILNVNEASKILMTKTLYKKLGLETSYLPKYSDENHTYSLSALLKKFKVGISAKKLNQILISNGILEIKTRKSTKKELNENGEEIEKIRTFKSLTEKGLEFGKNLISPHNQLETQPHYFENKFQELINELGI
jgi:hypothetical protein